MSILPIVAKVFELIVHRQLYEYLQANSLLHPAQSGLRSLHSIQDVLLKSVDDWRQALDRDEVTAAVFIDLSKAFDMIDHGLLLRKLEMYGVRDGKLTWFRNYLNDRRQRVIVGGARSSWHAVGRGVPQGSVLGPLLFSIFVNEMSLIVRK